MTASETHHIQADRESGFTLIELMVAVVLMSLILGVLGAGLRTVVSGWNSHSDRISDQDMFLRAAGLVRSDISGLQRIAWPPERDSTYGADSASEASAQSAGDKVAQKLNYIFHGEPQRLQFVVIEPPYPTRPGPYVLDYAVGGPKGGSLLRSRSKFHPDMGGLGEIKLRNEVTLVDGPYTYRFAYGHRTSETDETPGAVAWLSSWPYDDRLPELIRLEIRSVKTGRFVIPPLISRPKIDAELACAVKTKQAAGCSIKLAQGEAGVRAGQNAKGTDTK